MEVIRSSHHTAFPMEDLSRVGEARRHAVTLAMRAGFDEVKTGQLAIVVTELGTNLIRHAQRGTLLLAVREQSGEVEAISIDHGPGIADIARSMGDGYSTGGSLGAGLGTVRRMARDFDMHSTVPGGTVIVARLARDGARQAPADLQVGGVSVPKHGELVCGDAWAVAMDSSSATLAVVDGLGHGFDAAEASAAAIDVFAAEAARDVTQMLEKMHVRLRSTRGAAVTLLRADASTSRLRSCGAGNVSARVVSGAYDRSMLMQHGTAGLQMRRPEPVEQEWPQHAMIVVHSDGIGTRWAPDAVLPVLGRDPTLAAALLLRDHSRGRDDATVAVLRRRM
jgi:anti-sigma regulatory factor (Ser/Thr protein kinase)